jgi:N6-adenosine-specific RNA methylase IME4
MISPPFPTGQYKTILADPPWKYQNWTDKKNGAARGHYKTMTLEDIAALPVGELGDPTGCALFLWATFPKIREALQVIEAWGFRYVTCAFVWRKVYRSGAPYCGLGFC